MQLQGKIKCAKSFRRVTKLEKGVIVLTLTTLSEHCSLPNEQSKSCRKQLTTIFHRNRESSTPFPFNV